MIETGYIECIGYETQEPGWIKVVDHPPIFVRWVGSDKAAVGVSAEMETYVELLPWNLTCIGRDEHNQVSWYQRTEYIETI